MTRINGEQFNFDQFRKDHPEFSSCTDAEIISILNNSADGITLTSEQENSLFSGNIQTTAEEGIGFTNSEADLLQLLESRVRKVENDSIAAQQNNGVVGKAWHWIKNTVGIGDSSDDVEEAQSAELKLVKEGNVKKAFEELTGVEYTKENIEAFKKGEIKTKSETALDEYKIGQEDSSDFAGDMISGIASMGIYSFAIAAVATMGAPIALAAGAALGAAATIGAVVKVGTKAIDANLGDKKYESFGKDVLTGAVNGLTAPIWACFGGAFGKSAITRLGGKAIKEGADIVATNSSTSFFGKAMVNPMGNIYQGTLGQKATGYVVELGFDGAMSGATDATARAVYDGKSGEEILSDATTGAIGGAVGGIILGGAMKGISNAAHNAGVEVGSEINPTQVADVVDDVTPTPAVADVAEDVIPTQEVKLRDVMTPTRVSVKDIKYTPIDAVGKEYADAIENANVDEISTEVYNFAVAVVKSQEDFNDEIPDFTKALNQDVEEETFDILSSAFEKYPKVFASILEKDADGKFVYADVERYSVLLDKIGSLLEGIDFSVSQEEILKEINQFKKLSELIDDFKQGKSVSVKFGDYSDEKNALLEKAVKAYEKDDSMLRTVVSCIARLEKHEDIEFLSKFIDTCPKIRWFDFDAMWEKLGTPEKKAQILKYAPELFDERNSYSITYLIKLSELLELPNAEKRLEGILAIEDIKQREDLLNSYRNILSRVDDSNFMAKMKEFDLLSDERLSLKDIERITERRYGSEESFQYLQNLKTRNLLADENLSGDQIVELARLTEGAYTVYEKILKDFPDVSKARALNAVSGYSYYAKYYDECHLDCFPQLLKEEDNNWYWLLHSDKSLNNLKNYGEAFRGADHLNAQDIENLFVYLDAESFEKLVYYEIPTYKNLDANSLKQLSLLSIGDLGRLKSLNVFDKLTEMEITNIKMLLRASDARIEQYFKVKELIAENSGLNVDAEYVDIDFITISAMSSKSLRAIPYILKLMVYEDGTKTGWDYAEIDSLITSFGNDIESTKSLVELANEAHEKFKVSPANEPGLRLMELERLLELKENSLVGPQEEAIYKKVLEYIYDENRLQVGEHVHVAVAERFAGWALSSEQAEQAIKELLFIPERQIPDVNGNVAGQLSADFIFNFLSMVDYTDVPKYKEFFYSNARAEHGIPQMNNYQLRHLQNISRDDLDIVKPLLCVPERGLQQFDSSDLIGLAELARSGQLDKIRPLFNISALSDPDRGSRAAQLTGQQLANIAYSFEEKWMSEFIKLANSPVAKSFSNDMLINLMKTIKDEKSLDVFIQLHSVLTQRGVNLSPAYAYFVNRFDDSSIEMITNLLDIYPNLNDDIIWNLRELEVPQITRFVELLRDGYSFALAKLFVKSNDPQIQVKYMKALDEAKSKRNQLKTAVRDLTDADIEQFFKSNALEIVGAIDFLGVPAFTHSYSTKINGVYRLIESVQRLKSALTPEEFNDVKLRLSDKSLEPQERIAKLQTLSSLRRSKSVKEIIELIQPNTPTKEEIKLAKEIWANPKVRFDDKFNAFCEAFGIDKTNAKVVEFFEKRATVNAKGYKVLNNVKESDIAKLLEIEFVRGRNQKAWNKAIEEEIYRVMDIPYDNVIADKLRLSESVYVEQILNSNYEFRNNFGDLLDVLREAPEKTVREAFDAMPHNLETRRQFDELGIDYDAFVAVDKNSYRAVQVEANAEKMKQAAITNLEEDFNDISFKSLPKEEVDKIFDALKEIGVVTKKKEEPVYDSEGFIIRYQEMLRFYEGDEPISFNMINKAISVIKKVINENDFWSKTSNDSSLQEHKNTIYNHIMKLRDAEISNAAKLKADEVSQLEVRKTNMNDISHSLFLGNHGSCCTAVGTGCNQYAAPRYCMDKCISAIEVVDGKEFVGNSMMYFAKVDGELALVLDNIELNAKYQYNDKIRDAFMDYAKQICEEVGQPDIPIYAGPYRHKLNMNPYQTASHDLTIIGSTDGDRTYIDFVTGGYVIDGQRVSSEVNLFKIR